MNQENAISKPRTLTLTTEEKAELIELRDHAAKPYLRERASAILQVADGCSGRWVALHGLLRPRKPDTVYGWLDRYQDRGVDGLPIDEGAWS
ncbi:MAG: helix-turn-helix domain-containing protein [Anaerolineaceae bacterium]|nr:helix-turn-helix domain-containing protein [Anaerolineaceae bacterium]